MTIFSIDRLTKSYKKPSFTLNVEQFSLESGSILGLLGTNGSGKTTLLKLLLGISFPDAGTILWTNNPSNAANFIANNVSYMPEYKHLYQNMSTGKMLKFASQAIPHWNQNKAEKMVAALSLDTRKKISTLSYGEKTRLYAAITFSKDVPVIILDEPTGGLDPVMQERILEQIKVESLNDKTILFSSHQLNEVEESADVTAIIKAGEIILTGNLDDLKSYLFILTVPDNMTIPSEVKDNFSILAQRKYHEQIILLCRGCESARSLIKDPINSFNVNLKDIFLTINEGQVCH